MQQHRFYEDFARANDATIGSERNFGLTIGAALALLGGLSWYRGGAQWLWLLAAAALIAVAGLVAPTLLRPFNRTWFRFGLLLARLMQPIVLGLMFYVVLTPFALVLRRFARTPLGVGPRTDDSSYWITRMPEHRKDDLKNQF